MSFAIGSNLEAKIGVAWESLRAIVENRVKDAILRTGVSETRTSYIVNALFRG